MEHIAIIGTGISGMAAAYFLKDRYEVTFFDKNDYAGGHTHTLTVDENGQRVFIDSAFMVYNEITYPLLTRFFRELNVETMPTDMSFSVQHLPSGLEYCGTGFSGLFAQRMNVFSRRHWRMLKDIDRFNKEAVRFLYEPGAEHVTLEEYVRQLGLGEDCLNKFLVPMGSAVWSTPPEGMLKFPAHTLIRFFKNHGFLGGLKGHYQWRTVKGGSRVYRDRVMESFAGRVHVNTAVLTLERDRDQVIVVDHRQRRHRFDRVVLACHSDEALAIADGLSPEHRALLEKFRYQPNTAVLHTDEAVMPRTRRAWSSWNYRVSPSGKTSTVYWMNRLQNVSREKNYFISINDPGEIDPKKVLRSMVYHHPLFDVEAVQSQPRLEKLNENGRVYFCGAYFRYGFHEDGFLSGLNVARRILGENIWDDA